MVTAMESKRMPPVMFVGLAAPVAPVMMMSSKHVIYDPISLYRNDRYIETGFGQEHFRYI